MLRTPARAAALSLALVACTGEEPFQRPDFDLGENLAFATVSRETAEIDIGSIGDEGRLLEGWSHRESEPLSGLDFRWGLEPRSEIAFTVLEPRAVTLRLEGRPRRGPAEATRAVEVEINGSRAGRIELETLRQGYDLELPAELLRRGGNRLLLRYDLGGPEAVPAGEERAIAVAWYHLGFDGLWRSEGEPRFGEERDLLFLPFGSRVDYYLRAPAGAELRSLRRRFVAGEGMLTVHLDRDQETEQRLAAVSGDGELRLPLDVQAAEPIRLSLTAAATRRPPGGAGVVLEGPAVWTDAPEVNAEPPAVSTAGGVARPNILVYLVDTLRADHLGCYGHPRPVSPRIDRFAAGATLFTNARANAPWTLPAVASVMTGLWPPTHGVVEEGRRLAPQVVTLAEALSGAGYLTAGVVTNGFATGAYGLDQGFDELTLITARHSSEVHEAAVGWLDSWDRERPFFLYLHTIDPHKPYLPGEEQRLRLARDAEEVWRQIVANPAKQTWEPNDAVLMQLRQLYDAEIAENDANFGRTLDALEAAGLYDDALIVFLSDHGEEFYEHQAWTHAYDLFREVLNVPLIVKLPGQREGRRVAELAQQIDLMPTLLAYLDIDRPATQGAVLPALLTAASPARRPVFSHTQRPGQATASLIEGDWKLIRRSDAKGVTTRLFNWREDPAELSDRAAEHPILKGLLTATLERQLAESRPPAIVEATPDEAVLENLRALGYLD